MTNLSNFANETKASNSMDIEDLTLEEAEIVAAGITTNEALLIGGAILVFGAAIIIL